MNIGEFIKKRRDELKLSQQEVADSIQVSKSLISRWESGDVKYMGVDKLKNLSVVLQIDPMTIINFDEQHAPETEPSNIRVIELDQNIVRIPVVGRIPAGVPAEAIEDVIGYEEIPEEWTRGDNRYIGLVVEGDSMYPKYIEGDIVIIRLQQDCESGQDCACYVNGYDATLKTVKKGDGKITLTPVNTAYSPRTYVHPGEVEILGVVKELRRKF